jgi:hypothetical protein
MWPGWSTRRVQRSGPFARDASGHIRTGLQSSDSNAWMNFWSTMTTSARFARPE